MKKLFVTALCAILVISLAACGKQAAMKGGASRTDETRTNEGLGGNSVQIPNPFVDCTTLEDAQELAGFNMTVPGKMPEGYSESAIRVIKNKMIEVIYTNGDQEICIRKGTGSEDISGDYSEYGETNTVSVDDVQVTMKGNDGKVNVATWVDGEYTFAITVNPGGTGMDSAIISEMVNSIQ